MKTKSPIRLSRPVCLALALTATVPVGLSAQMISGPEMEKPSPTAMAMSCARLASEKQHLREDWNTQETTITAALVALQDAPEEQKMALMTALLTHLDESRSAMHERMQSMHEHSTQHMMEHSAASGGMTAACPAMRHESEGTEVSTHRQP